MSDDTNQESDQEIGTILVWIFTAAGVALYFCATHFMAYLSFEEITPDEAMEIAREYGDNSNLSSVHVRNIMTWEGVNLLDVGSIRIADMDAGFVSPTNLSLVLLGLVAWATFSLNRLNVRLLNWLKWIYTIVGGWFVLSPTLTFYALTIHLGATGGAFNRAWTRAMFDYSEKIMVDAGSVMAVILAMVDYHQLDDGRLSTGDRLCMVSPLWTCGRVV